MCFLLKDDCCGDQVQARQEGICQKRRELYSQCFDEVSFVVLVVRLKVFQMLLVIFGVVKYQFLVVSIVSCKVIRQSTIACPDRGLLLLRAKSHFDIHLFEKLS